jgi:putative GTP pyrophosphokinase
MQNSESEELEKLWLDQPTIIRKYVDLRSQYEQLVGEVSYILKRRIAKAGIETASISGRTKTLKSVAEKINRKDYSDPLKQITDFAGVRCVFLYTSDRSKIEKIIEHEFEIVEKIDKVEEKAEDEFGYGALHYIVRLGKASSGARYDDLKELVCEIQVRTVLQDAWAIIDHHLIYKKEKDAPKTFRRRLNSLSGLFETADAQFEQLRAEREKYLETLKHTNSESIDAKQELNVDLLWNYLETHFSSVKPAAGPQVLVHTLTNLRKHNYKTLADLKTLMMRTEAAREYVSSVKKAPIGISEVNRAIALMHESYRSKYTPKTVREALISALSKLKG